MKAEKCRMVDCEEPTNEEGGMCWDHQMEYARTQNRPDWMPNLPEEDADFE